jgi:hypothetical protein
MSHKTESMIRAGAIALLLATAAGQPAHAAAIDATCKMLFDATTKQLTTPTHVVATEVSARHGGKPTTLEMIYAGGAVYMKLDGQWKRSGMTAQDMLKQEEENRRNAKSLSCRYLRDETVDGEATAVYSLQSVSDEDTKSGTTLWLSKRSGLPVRSDIQLDLGDKSSNQHLTTRYDYANVRPPAGVK